ncbi:hypothetical protein VAB18032_13315 [Micromonospora maris AB-18-032]|nr:hypothetical protein VAB18032_13315 [Micromonospora maris AB-18-032]
MTSYDTRSDRPAVSYKRGVNLLQVIGSMVGLCLVLVVMPVVGEG